MGVGIASLRESLGEYAAGFDAALLSAAQAAEVVEQASRIEKMAATVKGLAVARVAETGSWRGEGDRSTAHQLARRTGTTVVQAAAAIDTARRLESLPATAAAARRGESVGRADLRHRRRRGGQHRRRARPAGSRPPLAAVRATGALRPHQGHGVRRPRGPPPPHPPAAVAPLLHRSRGRMAPPLPQQPRSGGPHHGRPRPHPGGHLPPARSESRHEPPDAYAADALAEMARRSW